MIQNTLPGLLGRGAEVGLLSGEVSPDSWPVPVKAVPDLAYRTDPLPESSSPLGAQLLEAGKAVFGGSLPDIWHIHNPTLGKNPEMPRAVEFLVEQGHRVLMHLHDFAEDGRPENYRVLAKNKGTCPLYPIGESISYAVINQRDALVLERAGIPAERVCNIGNPVQLPESSGSDSGKRANGSILSRDRKLFLYPTRGIRRKNIGEFLLLAATGSSDDLYATTMGPANPRWLAIHGSWERLASDLRLPVELGWAENIPFDFPSIFSRANCLLTTSVQEGFGLAFLEPVFAGKPLAGRNLDQVTRDFGDHGWNPGSLYERLEVELGWIDVPELRRRMDSGFRKLYAAYGKEWNTARLNAHWEAATNGADTIDFGFLGEVAQSEVIRKVAGDPGLRKRLRPAGMDAGSQPVPDAESLRAYYSPEAYVERLWERYVRLMEGRVSGSTDIEGADEHAVLMSFLDPGNLRLLKTALSG